MILQGATESGFTSHYVPIKSKIDLKMVWVLRLYLHPIMFLLNPSKNQLVGKDEHGFTSHYVPIKSIAEDNELNYEVVFTSHYVPIKSRSYKSC